MSQSTPLTQDAAPQSSEAATIAVPKGSIVLATSDGQKVPVDRLLLAATSSVFRNMLELGIDNKEELCIITESREDVLLFVRALKGQPPKNEITWLALYRMMDKYEAPIVRLICPYAPTELRCSARPTPVSRFAMLRPPPISAHLRHGRLAPSSLSCFHRAES